MSIMNCLIKFFTDRCHKKKDFRLFSRLKKQQFKVFNEKGKFETKTKQQTRKGQNGINTILNHT